VFYVSTKLIDADIVSVKKRQFSVQPIDLSVTSVL